MCAHIWISPRITNPGSSLLYIHLPTISVLINLCLEQILTIIKKQFLNYFLENPKRSRKNTKITILNCFTSFQLHNQLKKKKSQKYINLIFQLLFFCTFFFKKKENKTFYGEETWNWFIKSKNAEESILYWYLLIYLAIDKYWLNRRNKK